MFKLSKLNGNKKYGQPTKLLYKFQESRSKPPSGAAQTTRSSHEIHSGTALEQVRCPICLRANKMDHGDRILCGCDTILETYGNSLKYWKKGLKDKITFREHQRANATDFELNIVDRLTIDRDLQDLTEKHESVKDAYDNLITMIKLHENISEE